MSKIRKKNLLSHLVRETDKGNGWKVREVAGETAVERQTFYYFNGKLAPRIQLKSQLVQQLAGYTLIEKDLRNVLAWLQAIDDFYPENDRENKSGFSEDRGKSLIVKGLYVASLTFYGKCFSQCEGRRVKLDKKIIAPEFHDEHNELLKRRGSSTVL